MKHIRNYREDPVFQMVEQCFNYCAEYYIMNYFRFAYLNALKCLSSSKMLLIHKTQELSLILDLVNSFSLSLSLKNAHMHKKKCVRNQYIFVCPSHAY
jgi:hypothetical protein